MKANELRIGNYVEFPKSDKVQSTTVLWINFKCVDYEINGVHIKDIKPIPLTEEWLLKFGFKKREGNVCDEFYIGINPLTHDWLFSLMWIKDMMDYSYKEPPFYRNGYHIIQHVHQLQNLYFAITGDELTINEKL